jgi:hypothetical protein
MKEHEYKGYTIVEQTPAIAWFVYDRDTKPDNQSYLFIAHSLEGAKSRIDRLKDK